MPKSHDTKPRNRDRHLDVSKRFRGHVPSHRSHRRRVLRLRCRAQARMDQHLEAVLRERGQRWRDYEKSSKADRSVVLELAMERLKAAVGGPILKRAAA